MNKLKKNDIVQVSSGKDRGKSGRVLAFFPATSRVLVEGINFVKKHTRKSQKDPQGGIISKESPIHISNLRFLCKACNRPTRIGITKLSDGTRSRFCKKCNEVIG